MSYLVLASVPLTPLLLVGLLFLSERAEARLLSPRALVLSTVRARRSSPEYTEAMVARQFSEVLARQERRERERARA
jgi:hypothetical protein